MAELAERFMNFKDANENALLSEQIVSILIIDDDPSIRRGLDRIFSHQYDVITVENGKKGIEVLSNDVHCVILDVKMKGLDGFSTYPRLKEKSPDVPIIFYTAFQSEHDLTEVINQFKPDGYMEKGRDVSLLENLVQQAVNKYYLILENRRSQEALRESQAHFRSLMESATNFVIYRLLVEGSSPPDFSVVFVSPSIVDLMGVSDPMNFGTWFNNIHPDDRERIHLANLLALKTERFNEEMRICHPKEGDLRWIQAISTGVPNHNGPARYVNGIIIDITEKKLAEQALRQREKELEEKNRRLLETNTALDVLLKKRAEDKIELEARVLLNMEELVEPMLKELGLKLTDKEEKAYLEILEMTLKDITSPFGRKLSAKYKKFSPTEIQVADFIRHGKTTKDIALLLGISARTVEGHRKNIRKKTGIVNQKINLKTHLLSVLD